VSDLTLLTSLVEKRDGEDGYTGFTVVNLSGEPYAAAIVNAVTANYHRVTGRPKPDEQMLEEMVGEKVTLILGGENMLGSGLLIAREGKLFQSSRGGVGILPKGKRSKGYHVDPDKVVDLFGGWVAGEAAASVAVVRAHYPELVNLTQGRLEQLPGPGALVADHGRSEFCSLAVFGSNPLFGATDCIWLIGEYWPEDDICDTNVLLIRPEFGVSESGSCYGRDLLRNRALGEVVGFEPITFSEAISLCNLDFDEAVARVIPSQGAINAAEYFAQPV
jgi:hypothetical protein